MEQLTRLQARIHNLEELRELMHAMRAMAASHVQAAQSALEGIRQYASVIEDAIAAGVTLLPGAGAAAVEDRTSGELLILIGSEHGFVGGFNERLLERAAELLRGGGNLAVVGQRSVDLLGEHQLTAVWMEAMATQVGSVLGVARRVAARMAGVERARLIYAGYRRAGSYEVETRRILPLDPALLENTGVRSPPLHHLPAPLLLLQLANEYLVAELTRAIMESFASENGARLQVMESADRNIDTKLQRLGAQALTLRQASITAELLDLMTGAAASLGVEE